jgi:hypothetical protein
LDKQIKHKRANFNYASASSDSQTAFLRCLLQEYPVDPFGIEEGDRSDMDVLNRTESKIVPGIHGFKELAQRTNTKHTTPGFRQLALPLSLVQSSLRRVGTHAHPVDFISHSLEKNSKNNIFPPMHGVCLFNATSQP